MRSIQINRGPAARALGIAGVALTLLLAPSAQAKTTKSLAPHLNTGSVSHVSSTSAQLNASIDPEGLATTYHFQYGPTVAYGHETPEVAIGAGTKPVRVGQTAPGMVLGWHYRVVATNSAGTRSGKDKTFASTKLTKLKFHLPKGKSAERSVGYGGTYVLNGSLTGVGNANHGIVLQVLPYPYAGAFTTVSGPVLTTATGAFQFKIAKLTQNTEVRLLTTDPRPLYSPVTIVSVAPAITLHVVSSSHSAVARLYGTISPAAKIGGKVIFELLAPQKADSKREGPKPEAIGGATIQHGTSKVARFSAVLTIKTSGYYRVYLKLPKGALVSGYSRDVLIRAHKTVTKSKKKKKKK